MDIYHIIKRPLVTEKGTHQSTSHFDASKSNKARGGSFAFEVHRQASKPAIRQAIEKIYNVKVLSVRTANRSGKLRRHKHKMGKTADWKKAIVTLDPSSHIDLF
ncbi:MAG: 50S ribosomal protein L23 [Planctomycetes bacterium]|nr:50S ribosomal protein L23 [Planctomycetota bacterium]